MGPLSEAERVVRVVSSTLEQQPARHGSVLPMALGAGATAALGGAITAARSQGLDLATIVERVGLPAALLMAVLTAAYLAGRWVADQVIRPLMATHLRFVEATAQTNQRTAEAVERLGDAVEELSRTQGEFRREVENILQQQTDLLERGAAAKKEV